MSKKAILCILDGWGLAAADKYNAIDNAQTPVMDRLMRDYSWCTMKTDGTAVGLPEGQVGTSETNHLVIGSGTVPKQMLLKIEESIASGDFFQNSQLVGAFDHIEKNNSALHLVGIVSDGGVHSHINHLFALLDAAEQRSLQQTIYIHVFTDGRDTPPQSAQKYLSMLEEKIAQQPALAVKIASVQGRVYLDRDRDWSKTQQAVDLLVDGKGQEAKSWRDMLQRSYASMSSDQLNDQYHSQYRLPDFAPISETDCCLVFNFRADRSLQLLTQLEKQLPASALLAGFCKPSQDLSFEPLFAADDVAMPMSEVLLQHGKKQLHVTETEKHVHVTYYFNGKRESEVEGERWTIFESNRDIKPHYNKEPEMRAAAITDEVVKNIAADEYDFYVINYSNTDMVGHTGDYDAAVRAAEHVDSCLGRLVSAVGEKSDEYVLFVTADHGNSDVMWDYTINQPHTAHTHSPVPFIAVGEGIRLASKGRLQDIAPTILQVMGIEVPAEMTGKGLVAS